MSEAPFLIKGKDNAMGQGIFGAIPISFMFVNMGRCNNQEETKKRFQKYAADDIFDFYNETLEKVSKGEGSGTETLYTIKSEILLPNFKDFFLEYSGLIRDDWALKDDNISNKFNDDYDKAVASGNIKTFLKHFDDDTGRVPFIHGGFEAPYIDCATNSLFFYHGSYKAFLESLSTLRHMELLTRAAIRNPLAKVARFGIW
jgi:hypothetical protein